MKKLAVIAALAAAFGTAHAQTPAPAADTPSSVRLFAGGGLTYGGDRLATVPYNNEESDKVRAGGLFATRVGLEFRMSPVLSMQVAGGYHVHNTRFRNDESARFSRYPVELLLNYDVAPGWRVGAGPRVSTNGKLLGRGVAYTRYDNSTGLVLSGEYFVTPKLGLSARAVVERFEPEGGGTDIKGDHLGFFAQFYF